MKSSSTPKPKVIDHDLHPTGWRTDKAEERFKLSLFDPIILVVYCHFALYFRLDQDDTAQRRDEVADVLKEGLEKTLSQVRHLCGTIETDAAGGFSFVKKRDTTVRYVVKHLDNPARYPSIDDLEAAAFSCRSLGPDAAAFAVEGMPYGENRPESSPYNSPATSGFQLNFVRGGAVFSSHVHHWAADLVGWSNFVRQLADNCRAIQAARRTGAHGHVRPAVDWPHWDPACIDVSRFVWSAAPQQLVDGPPVVPPHPDHPREQQALLFHLPKSKEAALKAAAQPPQDAGAGPSWVSTYDAMCAFVWRALTRVRFPYYKPSADETRWFGESVDMRGRFRDPTPPPPRMIRNMLAGGFSDTAPGVPLPTLGEIAGLQGLGNVKGRELWRLARYVRRLTDSVTQASVEQVLGYIATLRDQQSVSFNLASKPPMSFFVTDHRPADVTGCDFGFGRPLAHRFLTGSSVSPNMILVYPPARSEKSTGGGGGRGGDEGTIWSITVEKDLVSRLLADPEWCEYFEYKGVD
ncbi:Uu.00g141060.m01.CDS01 [Anthostomella pinea]|uniref:Uu.00g141060.m01.CDS01 n=1 Tax=Anthostomella pinea TaxID=933095 RepID=A0AAI8YLK4_9PEZI|nr:Uu.00g141060.m01.CDS01 [Anthostomella pinea]